MSRSGSTVIKITCTLSACVPSCRSCRKVREGGGADIRTMDVAKKDGHGFPPEIRERSGLAIVVGQAGNRARKWRRLCLLPGTQVGRRRLTGRECEHCDESEQQAPHGFNCSNSILGTSASRYSLFRPPWPAFSSVVSSSSSMIFFLTGIQRKCSGQAVSSLQFFKPSRQFLVKVGLGQQQDLHQGDLVAVITQANPPKRPRKENSRLPLARLCRILRKARERPIAWRYPCSAPAYRPAGLPYRSAPALRTDWFGKNHHIPSKKPSFHNIKQHCPNIQLEH